MLLIQALFTILSILVSLTPATFQSPESARNRGKNGVKAASTAPATPVESPLQPGKADEVKLAVDLVVLDALVLHQKTDTAVGDLGREDFVLQEDGVRQQITNFSRDTLPLSVILLVDRGGCLDPFSDKVRRAAEEAMIRLKPQDEVALMSFADTPELVAGFTTHRERIVQALNRLPPHNEEAEHCFSEAFFRAAQYMKQAGNPDGRRVIIVITAITTNFDCGGHSNEDARQALLESGSVVCGIIPKTAEQRIESGIMRAITMFGRSKSKTNLKQLAEETGGEMLSDKPDNLDQTFALMIDHLRTRYTLGFVSTNTKRDGSFRKVKLEVSPALQKPADRMVVRTRRGYVASRR